MDNLCHTLVGAAIGEAGLKTRTAYGNATLMIAANLPDIDVLVFATGTPSVAFRRGWTHGVLAQALLPLVLTAVIYLAASRRQRRGGESPLHVGWLLALAYLGLYSHVLLDLLNNYGLRLLAPVNWRWFYGDSLFIVDPWLWLSLGAGTWLARRRLSTSPARLALVAATLYIGAMVISGRVARDVVADAWQAERGQPLQRLMVGPQPVTPLTRAVIVDAGDHYESGTFSWLPARVAFDGAPVPKNDRRPEVAAARSDPGVTAFLVWSRFPFWTLEPLPEGTRVTVADMRFMAGGRRFSASTVVPR
jgi:inner membrane protein